MQQWYIFGGENESEKKSRIIEIARTVASKSTMKIKHGAVIFYKNTLVASGYNTRNYKLSNTFSIHAEQNALNDFFKQKKHKCGFEFFSLFVVRLSDTGVLMNSKPCLNCSCTLLGVSCINRVFYSWHGIQQVFKARHSCAMRFCGMCTCHT